jgi:hypothetical protein
MGGENAVSEGLRTNIFATPYLLFVFPQVSTKAVCFEVQESFYLKTIVQLAILTTALLDGLDTYPTYQGNSTITLIDFVCLLIFIVEMTIKIMAQGSKPWRFFIGLEFLRAEEWRGVEPKVIKTKESTEVDTDTRVEVTITNSSKNRNKITTVQTSTSKENIYYDLSEEEQLTEENKYWNCFDFTIVGCCAYVLVSGGESSIGTLRLLRILRLIRAWPPLRTMSKGLATGLTASGSIMALFVFVMFLFALVGVDLFRENDPFHFLNGQVAFYSLYGISNMEWLDIAAGHLYGCDDLRSGGFYQIFVNTSAKGYAGIDEELRVLPDYFDGIGVLNEHIGAVYKLNEEEGGFMPAAEADDPMMPKELWCAPRQQVMFAVIYFTLYIIITGLILVTLFTGAVAVAMTDAVTEIAEEKKELIREARVKASESALSGDDEIQVTCYVKFLKCVFGCMGCSESMESGHSNLEILDNAHKCTTDEGSTGDYKRMLMGLMSLRGKVRSCAQMKLDWAINDLNAGSAGPDEIKKDLHNKRHLKAIFTPHGHGASICGIFTLKDKDGNRYGPITMLKALYGEFSMLCFELTNSVKFAAMVNLVIMAAACLAAVNLFSPATDTSSFDGNMLLVMKVVFSLEFLVKVFAEGAHPLLFFNDGWNLFDFVILIVTLDPEPNRALASLRALRLLKLIKSTSPKSFPQLHIVLAAFNEAVVSFQYVGALWFLIIYIFAIVGKDMYGENDPKSFGTLHGAIWTLFGASTFDGISDLMLTQIFGCDKYGAYIDYPVFTPEYYDPEYEAPDEDRRLLGDGMEDMMRELRGKKKKHRDIGGGDDMPLPCTPSEGGFNAFVFFFSYTTLSALILLSILLGVIQGGMESADERNQRKAERAEQIGELAQHRPHVKPYLDLIISIFDDFDVHGEGELSIDEFANAAGGSHEAKLRARRVLEAADSDHSGTIDLEEFCDFLFSKSFDKSENGSTPTASTPGARQGPTTKFLGVETPGSFRMVVGAPGETEGSFL